MFQELQKTFLGHEENRLAATVFHVEDSLHAPVLFMHGGGQTRYSWKDSARRIAALGMTSIIVDARGHGESDWVESKNYTFWNFAKDLLSISRDIKNSYGHPPVLVGASLGGISALLAQEKDPDIFQAIVLVDITPRMEMSGVDKIQGFMGAKMEEGFATAEEAAEAIAAYLPDRKRPKSLDGLRKNLRLQEDGRLYWHWDPAFMKGPATINSGLERGFETLEQAAAKITVPTLLVRGQRSELVTETAAREFVDLVPHARFVDVSDAGHMVAGDKNDAFTEAIIDFLKADVLQDA